MVDDSIIRKIKRCMELTNSANEHEAALAFKQMQSLMQKHGVTVQHVLAADITEYTSELDVLKRPPNWVMRLHKVVGAALDCETFISRASNRNIRLIFLGVGAVTEIAGYAFDVLLRKLKEDRAAYIKTKLKRFKRSNKIKLADAFCEGWVNSIGAKVRNLNPNLEVAEKIKAYTETRLKNYKADQPFKTTCRFNLKNSKASDALLDGVKKSKAINLFVPAGHTQQGLIGESHA